MKHEEFLAKAASITTGLEALEKRLAAAEADAGIAEKDDGPPATCDEIAKRLADLRLEFGELRK